MVKKNKKVKMPKDLQIEMLNKEQLYWRRIEDSSTATIKQFEDSIKLNKAIREMAKKKIIELRQ